MFLLGKEEGGALRIFQGLELLNFSILRGSIFASSLTSWWYVLGFHIFQI